MVDTRRYDLGRDVMGLGSLGSRVRSWDLRAFPLLFCENRRNENRDIVGRDARESRVKVVEGELPRISAQGYIIISKVKIYY